MGQLQSFSSDHASHPVDWHGPLVMFACFVGAIFFAVGHHVLNLCLQGKVTTEFPIDQQWISRGENAVAYTVKLLLVLATGTAYVQCVWHHARGRPTKITHFDTMFGVLDNIVDLRHLRFWFRRPILLGTVAVVWFIPLVAIITPGTLSVVSASISEPKVISVQQRDFGKSLYAAAVQADNGTVFYGGARSYLKGPTLATLVETEILSVGAPSTNLTYSMAFYGPAISCSKADPQATTQLSGIVTEFQASNQTSLLYDAWVPKPNATSNETLVDGSIVLDSDSSRNLRILDQTSPDSAKIYYSLAPVAPEHTNTTTADTIYVIECALYNASWHLDFDVRSTGEQMLTPHLTFENWTPGWSSINPPLTAGSHTNAVLDYAGLLETFGSITSGQLLVPDDPSLPFTQTSLALETSPVLFADVTPDTITEQSMATLARALESLFQNMTLSARYAVLPQQELRGDTALLSHVDVNATSTFFRNVYAYDARDLIIAYSLAVVGSAVCILSAMLAVRDMGAVYSNSFSTAVRVTRGQSCLDHAVIVDEHDRSGAEPLPTRIAEAYIWVGKARKIGMGMGRGRVETTTTRSSQDSASKSRSWWGSRKRRQTDLEKRLPKDWPVSVVRDMKDGGDGGWI